MINLTDKINMAPLGPGCTPNPSFENPIDYKGWKIRSWTGWKGCDAEIEASDGKMDCRVCIQPFNPGDKVILRQGVSGAVHSDCSKDPLKGLIFGQWLAYKGDKNQPASCQYAYASVPGGVGLYKRGDCFDLSDESKLYCFETVKEELEYQREGCLNKLKAYIDSVETPVYPVDLT